MQAPFSWRSERNEGEDWGKRRDERNAGRSVGFNHPKWDFAQTFWQAAALPSLSHIRMHLQSAMGGGDPGAEGWEKSAGKSNEGWVTV